MKAGRFGSLALVAILVIIAMIVGVSATAVLLRHDLAPLTVLLFGSVVLAVLFAALLIPLGAVVDSSLEQLRQSIEQAASGDCHPTYTGPRVLTPLVHAFTKALDQFARREEAQRHEIRDLEIRCRVSEAQRRLVEAVLNALRDGVIVTDAFDEVVMANEQASQIFGFDHLEAVHVGIDSLIDHAQFTQLIRDAREAASFSDCRHTEITLPIANNSADKTTTFDVALACVPNHKNEVCGVVAILYDLTREREVSQLKSDFVSKTSHELRTPLSSIRAYVEMLLDGEAKNEKARQEFYRIIQNETDRLGRLIDNMLNISRIEAGIIQIERERVDIKQLVKSVIDTLEPQARERGITVHARLAAVDLTVEGDADMLYQVILNLLSNAVKYTPEGGRITVSGDSDNLTRSVVVTVADTGLGIPPDALPKLFEKFYRVESYKRMAKGTGLGLSLCKHIVETVHRGQIGVESKLGMGSKFWFSVPAEYAGSQAAA